MLSFVIFFSGLVVKRLHSPINTHLFSLLQPPCNHLPFFPAYLLCVSRTLIRVFMSQKMKIYKTATQMVLFLSFHGFLELHVFDLSDLCFYI
ncbi:hypothetical protein HanRHA438_Chr03g0102291 [Helianthus annuus]|nr:hypothetical protein HanRHA438_Chr03g0102291 [Helianthus annuus]